MRLWSQIEYNFIFVSWFIITITNIFEMFKLYWADPLKKKLLKPWKGAHSSHFRVCLCLCLSVCLSVRKLLVTVFELGM